MDFEIFSADALNKAWENIRSKFEDVEKFYNTFICPTDYIINSSDFKKYDMISNVDMSKIRLTLDYQEDFELISKIFDILYIKNQYFTLEDIIELLKKNPSLMSINKKYADIRFNSSMK